MAASKYGNKRTVVDGYKFDSLAEARRYSELKLMERAGEIKHLSRQVRFPLHCHVVVGDGGDEHRIVTYYVADFVYYAPPDIEPILEDVKGARTAMYRLKRKWMLLEYGIEIQEIEA